MTDFPPDFRFGVSTAAYQIEGAAKEDGRTESIWDTFSHTPGKIQDGDTGDVACDHYHRYVEDVGLMREIGPDAYRFSVAWPRIVPAASGEVNVEGLDFYARLVDELLAQGITPMVTLYHWDLPQWLQDLGGWTNRDTAARFADYVQQVASVLGDRVDTFTTLNEPWCSAFLGHASGVHAPGLTDREAALSAAHHLMLAHGRAVTALRATAPRAQLSATLNLAVVRGASDSDADRAAVRHVDGLANRVFLEPMLRGRYPDDILAEMSPVTDWAFVRDGDLQTISAPIDILGVNYYAPSLVTAATPELAAQLSGRWVNDPQGAPGPTVWPGTELAYSVPQPGPYTAMNWRIEPAGLTELLVRLHRDYPDTPLMVTENGAAFDDVVAGDSVHDAERIGYLRDHIDAVGAAIAAGADVRGYYVWSLLDNFEWAWGFSKRFGLVHVDYDTQQRRLKDSALWYRDRIEAHRRSR
ncbi:MAG TPA: beta-glucosidase [Jatrophihabitantaceae bacterium]